MDIPSKSFNDEQHAQIIDTTFYSTNFPQEDWNSLIQRNHLLTQIEHALDENSRIVFIDGDEDAGKSIISAQFVKKHVNSTISIFFNPLNSLDYHVDYYCTNAVLQISYLLNESIPEEDITLISTEQYRQKLFQYRKTLKRNQKRLNIVIDGLELKAKTDPQFIREIFTILHLGEDCFKFIISGKESDFLAAFNPLKSVDIRTVTLMGFSDAEVVKYLNIKDEKENKMGDLYKVTKGYPGRLKTLKRIIEKDGYSLEKISSSTNYKNWLQMDCEKLDFENPTINAIVSLLSLTENSFSIENIADICSLDVSKIQQLITKNPIFKLKQRIVSITSSAHKKYLASILRSNKQRINDLLIEFYANNDSLNSLLDLPNLYTVKREWDKVIEILNEQNLNKILEQTGSLKVLTDRLELGVNASENLNKHQDLLRYSIYGSIVNELDNYLFWESEVEARISIRDFSGAISLAESAILVVDRLKLLALIARRQKEFEDTVDEVLITLIQDLYNSIDLSSAGDKIYDIVSHLIYALPNLAIDIIEKSSSSVNDKNINDWVVAKLSIAAIDSNLSDGERQDDTKKLQAVQNLNNPSVKKIQRAISFLVGNYTAQKVLDEVDKISDPLEKLRLLRLWLRNNKNQPENIEMVIDTALDELVKSSSETSITVEVLEELSSQLPYVKNLAEQKKMFDRFKKIEDGLSQLGLVKSKYVYKLNIFHTEFYINESSSVGTINKLIIEIDAIDDILIKLESYAEAFSKLSTIRSPLFENKINFLYARILDLTKSLYNTTALQFEISEHFLRPISKQNPRLALKIIEQMNNSSRRDKSRLLVLESYLDNNIKFIKIDKIKEIELSFENNSYKTILSLETLERFSEVKSLHPNIVLELLYFYKNLESTPILEDRLRSLLLSFKIINKDITWKQKLSSKIGNQIYQCWKGLEADWDRIDKGFALCYELSKYDPILSKKLFNETEQLKVASWLDSQAVAFTYLNSIKLALKGFFGLLQSNLDTQEDYQIIEDLISRIPSEVSKLLLWTEFGFYCLISEKNELLKRITNDHIIHLTHGLIEKKLDYSANLTSLILIYIANPRLAEKYLNNLDVEDKERALFNICIYYITKQNPFEPYDFKIVKYPSTFSDLTAAIGILLNVKNDLNIYALIETITNALKKNEKDISKTQLATLISELKLVIDRGLPDKKNIKHDGFKLLAELKVAKISRHLSISSSFWEDLYSKISSIPNLSDLIFVQAAFLEDFPFDKITNGSIVKRQLYDSIVSNLNVLPVHYEFVERVIDISEVMFNYDQKSWKKLVERAFTISSDFKDGSDIYNSQKNLIDSMYRLNPSFAKDLIKQMDTENKHKKISKLLNNHYQTLEVAQKIKNNKTLEQKEKEDARVIVQSILMTLRGLNSERIVPKKINEIITYLKVGNKLPLHEAYPIFLYYLTNCAKMYRSQSDSNIASILKGNFRELITVTNLIQVLSHKKKITEKSYRKFFIDEEFATNKPIKPKSREDAFNFIKKWLTEEAEEFLIIADPYFSKDDLEILLLIKQANISLDIDILGSKDGKLENCENIYKKVWRDISDEEAPFVKITFCRTVNNSEPFHDRWIITKNSGLRLGTSINSLGVNKESEISVMLPNEALKIREQTLLELVTGKKREIGNEKLTYNGFTMS
jgi:hypothetical protein